MAEISEMKAVRLIDCSGEEPRLTLSELRALRAAEVLICDGAVPSALLSEVPASCEWAERSALEAAQCAGKRVVVLSSEPQKLQSLPIINRTSGRRVALTCPIEVFASEALVAEDAGFCAVAAPRVCRELTAERVKIRPSKGYTLLVCSSNLAADAFWELLVSPVCFLPKKFAVTSPSVWAAFACCCIDTVMPEADFTEAGLLASLPEDLSGQRVLRIRFEDEGPSLAEALKARGAKVKDLVLGRLVPTEAPMPSCDAVLLTSVPAAETLNGQGDVPVLTVGASVSDCLRSRSINPSAEGNTVAESLACYRERAEA